MPLPSRVLVVSLALVACRNDGGTRTQAEPVAPRADVALPEVALTRVVDGLVAPTEIVARPDGTLVVLDQPGRIYAIEDGALRELADLRARVVPLEADYDERGLLGIAYPPDRDDGHVYVYYSAPLSEGAAAGYDHTNVLAEMRVRADGHIDVDSARTVIALDWPAPNHDGGTIAFGPDGYLYVAMGDGGKAGDSGRGHPPMGNGQDWTTLMGSILRIDPRKHGDAPYRVPPDNPFVGEHEGKDEIWAYGLRNPYAFSFDRENGRMFAGDVGQELHEEVDLIERGKNYGWHVKEGEICYDPDDPHRPKSRCANVGEHGEPLVAPIVAYPQLDSMLADTSRIHGISVIGGNVYRGAAIPALTGAYVFGDWSRVQERAEGMLLVARESSTGWTLDRLRVRGLATEHLGRYVRGFGEDAAGELYLLTSDREGLGGTTGVVWRIDPK